MYNLIVLQLCESYKVEERNWLISPAFFEAAVFDVVLDDIIL